MKLLIIWLASAGLLPASLFSAPDFPAHHFKSTLPASALWELKQQFNDPARDAVMRSYVDTAGGRAITLLLGKNNTAEKGLTAFAERYMNGLAQKPQFKIVSSKTGGMGDLPAKIIIAEVRQGSGDVHHMIAAVAAHGEKFYICTLVSQKMQATEDEVLMSFLLSVQITK